MHVIIFNNKTQQTKKKQNLPVIHIYVQKCTACIILNSDTECFFSEVENKTKKVTFTTSLQHYI